MKIETQPELEAWLDANFWLKDIVIKTLEPLPNEALGESNESETAVALTGEMHVGGSYQAGEMEWVRDIEITARGMKSYSISPAGFVEGNCCQGAELIENEELGFTLDVPGDLRIACTSLEVLQCPDRQETVTPWFSTTGFFVDAKLHTLPTPKEWISHLRNKGWDVVWRCYGGSEKNIERIPLDDYAGYFIQLRSRLEHNPEGLFFKHCGMKGGQFSLSLRKGDFELQGLWVEIGKYVAAFPEVTISCGNTEMNGTEWLSYLAELDTQS